MSRSHKSGQSRKYRDAEYFPLVEEDMTDSTREETAKHAANVLYGALPQTSYNPHDVESNQSQSYSSDHMIYSEREMKFSSVRRMFCLVTLFDLLFIFLLWMLHASISLGLKTEFHCQLEKYNFKTSLFDIVLLSAVRAILLLLAYALCKSKHWFMVAFTTFATCAFLISKVIVFDWNQKSSTLPDECHRGSSHPLDYIIFLISFAMAWIETWLLDWKVLPREKKFAHMYERQIASSSERAPLLGSNQPQRTNRFESYRSDPGSEFYTPSGSESESEVDSDENGHRKGFHSLPTSRSASFTNLHLLEPKDQEYYRKGKDAMEKLLQILKTEDGWKLEKENGTGVTVYARDFGESIGRLYKMQGIVEIDARCLFEELFYKLEDSPKWNPTVSDAKILHTIDDHTDISYNQAAEAPGGIVSTRDFVTVRHWQLVEGMYISSGQAVEYEGMPPKKNCVRGCNGPGGWAIKELPGKPAKCHLTWILNTDLKFQGWMPQYIIDQALTGVLVDIYKYITLRVRNMKSLHKTL
ncbi:stAR-related lipid transfer protein 3-like isoform X2 [Ptychodera flava]